MNQSIAVKLARAAIELLGDVPPSVPLSDAPLAFVRISSKPKPKQEYKTYIAQRRRDARRNGQVHMIHLI